MLGFLRSHWNSGLTIATALVLALLLGGLVLYVREEVSASAQSVKWFDKVNIAGALTVADGITVTAGGVAVDQIYEETPHMGVTIDEVILHSGLVVSTGRYVAYILNDVIFDLLEPDRTIEVDSKYFCNSLITIYDASSPYTVSLGTSPGILAGCEICLFNSTAYTVTVDPGASRIFYLTDATGDCIQNATPGDSVCLVYYTDSSPDYWFPFQRVGTWVDID